MIVLTRSSEWILNAMRYTVFFSSYICSIFLAYVSDDFMTKKKNARNIYSFHTSEYARSLIGLDRESNAPYLGQPSPVLTGGPIKAFVKKQFFFAKITHPKSTRLN